MWNKMHSWQGEERSRRWKYDCHLGFGLDRARLISIDQPMQSRTRSVFRKDKNISYVSHIFPRRHSSSQLHLWKVPFLIPAGQLHQRYRNTCFLKHRDKHSVYWHGLAWQPYRESIDALETLHQVRICSIAAKRWFEHMCKFASKTFLFIKNSDSFFVWAVDFSRQYPVLVHLVP